jgi:hypothetical protein
MQATRAGAGGSRSAVRGLLVIGAIGLLGACREDLHEVPVPYVAAPLPGIHGEAAPRPKLSAQRARKICQLVGDRDAARDKPIANATGTRFGVIGTDLGITVERSGELVFLFGDTWNRQELSFISTQGADAFATLPADGKVVDACHHLAFAYDGGDQDFAPITLDGRPLPTFEVPTGAFATAHHLYAFFTVADEWGRTIGDRGGRGILARSAGDQSFETVKAVSSTSERFNMVSAAVMPAGQYPELPPEWASRELVLAYGIGHYRESFPRLALAEANHPAEPWIYFAGWDASGAPRFAHDEESSMPLFPDEEPQACVGEMSVAWAPHIDRWLMTYNCRGRILLRAARAPWGPWSQSLVLFDKKAPESVGVLHRTCAHFAPPCDDANVSPGFGESVAGDPYGPYMIPRFFSSNAPGHERIVFTMSTWNPYTTVLMEAELAIK